MLDAVPIMRELTERLPADARAFGTRNLDALVRKEFIASARPGAADAGYRFRHILIQQAAYRATPKLLRAETMVLTCFRT